MWVFFYTAWLFFGRETFEFGQAFIIYASSLVLLIQFKNKITESFHIIALNQLADEIFFDPYLISWNEYLTIGVLLLLIFTPFSLTSLTKLLISKTRIK